MDFSLVSPSFPFSPKGSPGFPIKLCSHAAYSDPGGFFRLSVPSDVAFALALLLIKYSLGTHTLKLTRLNNFTYVAACELSVYASLWSLPPSLQDSIHGSVCQITKAGLFVTPVRNFQQARCGFSQRTPNQIEKNQYYVKLSEGNCCLSPNKL